MEEAKRLIEELSLLIGKTDTRSEQRREEIALWFRDNSTPENDTLFDDFTNKGVREIAEELSQIGSICI